MPFGLTEDSWNMQSITRMSVWTRPIFHFRGYNWPAMDKDFWVSQCLVTEVINMLTHLSQDRVSTTMDNDLPRLQSHPLRSVCAKSSTSVIQRRRAIRICMHAPKVTQPETLLASKRASEWLLAPDGRSLYVCLSPLRLSVSQHYPWRNCQSQSRTTVYIRLDMPLRWYNHFAHSGAPQNTHLFQTYFKPDLHHEMSACHVQVGNPWNAWEGGRLAYTAPFTRKQKGTEADRLRQ